MDRSWLWIAIAVLVAVWLLRRRKRDYYVTASIRYLMDDSHKTRGNKLIFRAIAFDDLAAAKASFDISEREDDQLLRGGRGEEFENRVYAVEAKSKKAAIRLVEGSRQAVDARVLHHTPTQAVFARRDAWREELSDLDDDRFDRWTSAEH
jgi:hypothetical protein